MPSSTAVQTGVALRAPRPEAWYNRANKDRPSNPSRSSGRLAQFQATAAFGRSRFGEQRWPAWAARLAPKRSAAQEGMLMGITDIVQTIAIVASVLGLIYQLRREWLLHSAEMVTDLVAQFNSAEFEKRRRSLAVHLEPVTAGKPVSLTSDYGLGVLGFYENISHLVRRRALDEMM